MAPLQVCPSRVIWQEILEGRFLGASTADWGQHLDSCADGQKVVEELTGGTRTWLNIAGELRQPAAALPDAGLRALENLRCKSVRGRSPVMTPRIHIERMMHRSSIAVAGESAVA